MKSVTCKFFRRHIPQLRGILNVTQADTQEWQTHLAMLFDQCRSRMLFTHKFWIRTYSSSQNASATIVDAAVAMTKSDCFLAGGDTEI